MFYISLGICTTEVMGHVFSSYNKNNVWRDETQTRQCQTLLCCHDVAPLISRCGFRDKRKNGNAATSQASFRVKRQNIEEDEQHYE